MKKEKEMKEEIHNVSKRKPEDERRCGCEVGLESEYDKYSKNLATELELMLY